MPIRRAIQQIDEVLGNDSVRSDDPIADYWESEVAAGRVPDLEITRAELAKKPGWEWVKE